jgi:hypothetical protein
MALIGPMLGMTIPNNTNTSLITVSIATFIFALLLAWGAIGSAGKDVSAATAAYAAVLVVFVGANSSGSWRGINTTFMDRGDTTLKLYVYSDHVMNN